MEVESKQPHTSSLWGRQILERRKEIDPIRKHSASNGARQEPSHQTFWCEDKLVDMLKETDFGTNPAVAETSPRYGACFPNEILAPTPN